MATLTVIAAFGSYTAGQTISDPTTVAAILAGPNAVRVVSVADSAGTSPGTGGGTTPGGGGSTSPGTGTTPTPGLTLSDVDGEIATAFAAKGVPAGQTVPGLIGAAIAQAGTGTGITAAQAAAFAIALG